MCTDSRFDPATACAGCVAGFDPALNCSDCVDGMFGSRCGFSASFCRIFQCSGNGECARGTNTSAVFNPTCVCDAAWSAVLDCSLSVCGAHGSPTDDGENCDCDFGYAAAKGGSCRFILEVAVILLAVALIFLCTLVIGVVILYRCMRTYWVYTRIPSKEDEDV